jgi:hypothetical protein
LLIGISSGQLVAAASWRSEFRAVTWKRPGRAGGPGISRSTLLAEEVPAVPARAVPGAAVRRGSAGDNTVAGGRLLYEQLRALAKPPYGRRVGNQRISDWVPTTDKEPKVLPTRAFCAERVTRIELAVSAWEATGLGCLRGLRPAGRRSMSFFELATDQVTVHEAQRARPPSC